jgi:hypothetical protein
MDQIVEWWILVISTIGYVTLVLMRRYEQKAEPRKTYPQPRFRSYGKVRVGGTFALNQNDDQQDTKRNGFGQTGRRMQAKAAQRIARRLETRQAQVRQSCP